MSTKLDNANIVVEEDLVGDYVLSFKEEILSVVEAGEAHISIDMTNVRILGSSAIGVLASAMNSLKLSKGTITLKGLNPEILRVLKLMGMANTFIIEE